MNLYHGILKENFQSMKNNGVNPNSYWGEDHEAIKYSDCNKMIKIDVEKSNYTISPNLNMIQSHLDSGDIDTIEEWNLSNKTWIDSLRIFGSVIIEERVFFDEEFDIT